MGMRFVVWGAGKRGKKLLNIMGKERITAFIEGNPELVGGNCEGIPVIDFETYKKDYNKYLIVISPFIYEDILNFLYREKVFGILPLQDCPSEVQGLGVNILSRELPIEIAGAGHHIIYGMTLYSILLYEYLKAHSCARISIMPSEEMSTEVSAAIGGRLKEAGMDVCEDIPDSADNILISVAENEDSLQRKAGSHARVQDAYDLSDRIEEYSNRDIKKFKNIHDGERCFIIATGPSLRIGDLDTLKANRELCISMNRINCAFKDTAWRPDYYVVGDEEFIRCFDTEIRELEIKEKFVSDKYPPFWEKSADSNIYRYHTHSIAFKPESFKFSEDFSKGEYGGGTVTYTCLQLAVYMGFKEIYLLGVDFNYTSDVKSAENHFTKDYYVGGLKAGNFARQESLLAYCTAQKYAEEHHIKIYNATRGGKLEVFRRVDFDDLF